MCANPSSSRRGALPPCPRDVPALLFWRATAAQWTHWLSLRGLQRSPVPSSPAGIFKFGWRQRRSADYARIDRRGRRTSTRPLQSDRQRPGRWTRPTSPTSSTPSRARAALRPPRARRRNSPSASRRRRGPRSRARARRCARSRRRPSRARRRRRDGSLTTGDALRGPREPRACAAAAPRSRAEIAAVAELLRNAPAPAPRPSPSKRRRRRGFFAAGAAEQAAAVHEDAPSAELARCLAALSSSSSESAAASTTAVGLPSSSIRQAAGLLAELALRTRAREGGYYGARPVDDRGAARLAFGDAGGVEALAALGTDAGLEAAAAACAGCPPNVSRLRETALLPRALRSLSASDAALRVVVDATHLHPPSTKLVGADGASLH